ncbi:MAG: hypothetical protein N2C12_13285, partial [Planctomycetales bacterium]
GFQNLISTASSNPKPTHHRWVGFGLFFKYTPGSSPSACVSGSPGVSGQWVLNVMMSALVISELIAYRQHRLLTFYKIFKTDSCNA